MVHKSQALEVFVVTDNDKFFANMKAVTQDDMFLELEQQGCCISSMLSWKKVTPTIHDNNQPRSIIKVIQVPSLASVPTNSLVIVDAVNSDLDNNEGAIVPPVDGVMVVVVKDDTDRREFAKDYNIGTDKLVSQTSASKASMLRRMVLTRQLIDMGCL